MNLQSASFQPSFLPMPPQALSSLGQKANIPQLLAQLGQHTALRPDGLVQLNYPLIETLVAQGQTVLPSLYQWFSQASRQPVAYRLGLIEALYLGHRLAEERVLGIEQLYGATKVLNYTADPLLQVYLGAFYRKLNAPHSAGPLLMNSLHTTLMNRQTPGFSPQSYALTDPSEEAVGNLIAQIARKTAEETVWRLQPYLLKR